MAVQQIKNDRRIRQVFAGDPRRSRGAVSRFAHRVTNFFRDPIAFKALEDQVIPKLFSGKPDDDAIRVCRRECSTGEEAYSIAILLQERMDALKQSRKVQVFATDIDGQAITVARAGLYPASIIRRHITGAAGALFRGRAGRQRIPRQ